MRQVFQKGGDKVTSEKYTDILAAMAERSNRRMTILVALMAAALVTVAFLDRK